MRYLVFSLLLTLMNLKANNERPIIELSIPKCGTNLLRKCIEQLTGKILYWSKDLLGSDFVHANKDKYFYSIHFRYTPENKKRLFDLNDPIVFLIYRDPRDHVISYIYYCNDYSLNKKDDPNKKLAVSLRDIYKLEDQVEIPKYGLYGWYYQDLTFDEIILQVIFGGAPYYDGMGPYLPNYKTKGVADFYYSYFGWFDMPEVCLIRFEDLIGPLGGGSLVKQLETITRIADHLGVEVTQEKILNIVNTMFGNSPTFRKGQIGAWKTHFKPIHKRCFKAVAGQLLIDLGYEDSFDW